MIDTDKYEGHTEDIERWQMMARSLPVWANDKDKQLVRDAPLLLAEVKRLHEWIYHHANNLDAGGVHRMGTPQPLSTFADEAREAIGVKRGEVHYLSSLLEEVKRLREEVKVLSKYRDIVNKYDDALLADGDTDPRWSELYD